MIAIVVELKVPSNGAKDFRALAEQHARRCLEREPGCLQFDITQDPADPEQWLFYERYRDEAALDAHRKTDYLAKFLEVDAVAHHGSQNAPSSTCESTRSRSEGNRRAAAG